MKTTLQRTRYYINEILPRRGPDAFEGFVRSLYSTSGYADVGRKMTPAFIQGITYLHKYEFEKYICHS